MIQEIITYVIVALAIGLTVFKSYKKLKRKSRVKSSFENNKNSELPSGCSDCVAECILRNTTSEVKNENAQLCERSVKKLKCS